MSGPRDDRAVSPAEAPTVEVGSGRPRGAEHEGSTLDHEAFARDSFDDVLRRVVATGAGAPLAVGVELAGRFTIARVLGQGGMGTVYVARDATLGREVAIKIHHAAGGAHRLRREAVAMARLAHPHVVTVFEVDEVDGRPFVVMEYVPGQTLRAWLAAAPRSVRDVLAMLLAAGDGLAAAHDAGLIHRDVKPENVLIGDDGRARVGDFGLARELAAGPTGHAGQTGDDVPTLGMGSDIVPPSAEYVMTPVTQTGAVLGTPAYMAPEQFAGAPIDARADQFAYCVTAWEALWRQRPFAGETFDQLQAAIARGERRPAPTTPKVPARVRLALERGMATDPAARFASMRALLDAMRPPVRRRARGIAAGAGAIALAAGALLWPRAAEPPSCARAGGDALAALRRDLPRAVAAHGFAEIAARANATQWRYLAGFHEQATLACEAGWSPELAARSQTCLAVTGRTAALALTDADATQPMDVLRRLRRLPAADACRNPTYLAALPAPPRDPAQLAAVTDARAMLAVGLDSVDDHDAGALAHAIAQLEASPTRSDPSIAAGLTVLHALAAFQAGQIADARKLFVDAYYAARAIDDDPSASAALRLLIGYADRLGLEPAAVKDWLRTALADGDRIRVRSPALAGKIYVTGARAADLGQDADTALRFVARARAVVAPGSPLWIASLETEAAVKMWSGKPDEGATLYAQAIAAASADLGADDPDVAAMLGNFAASLLDVERVDAALVHAERAMQIIRHLADPDDDRIDPIRVNLAAVLLGANRKQDEALALLTTARAHYVKRYGEASSQVANIDINQSIVYNDRGEHGLAIARLRSALAIDEKLLGKDHLEVAVVWFNLAAAHRMAKDYPAAIAASLAAVAILSNKSPGSDRHRLGLAMAANAANDAGAFGDALGYATASLAFEKPPESVQTSAWAQLERGRALLGLHRGHEARPFLVAARRGYAELVMPQRVSQCEALLAQVP